MSFNGTHTPTKADATKKQRYFVPTFVNKYGITEYRLTPELRKEFIRLYPVTMNRDLMGLFGLSFSTMQRFKRELGLCKNRRVILRKHAKQVKRICEQNGYYERIKGTPPTPQCIEASRKWRAEGNHPKEILKRRNPRKYKRMLKEQGEKRRAQFADERRRVRIGLEQNTDLHIPQFAYTKQQLGVRYRAFKCGYVLGDTRDRLGERYTIYWNSDTERKPKFEANFGKYGFTLKELPEPKKPRKRELLYNIKTEL